MMKCNAVGLPLLRAEHQQKCSALRVNEDRDIIIRVLAGERNAFEAIILKYEEQVFRWLGRMVPQSAVQETAQEVFVRAYQDLRSYRADAPFSHWLSRLSRNVAYDHWRNVRRDKLQPVDSQDLEFLEQLQTVDAAQGIEARDLLERIFSLLAPDERLLFTLYYVDERSIREISSELGLGAANVKIRLFRARKRIQRLLRG